MIREHFCEGRTYQPSYACCCQHICKYFIYSQDVLGFVRGLSNDFYLRQIARIYHLAGGSSQDFQRARPQKIVFEMGGNGGAGWIQC